MDTIMISRDTYDESLRRCSGRAEARANKCMLLGPCSLQLRGSHTVVVPSPPAARRVRSEYLRAANERVAKRFSALDARAWVFRRAARPPREMRLSSGQKAHRLWPCTCEELRPRDGRAGRADGCAEPSCTRGVDGAWSGPWRVICTRHYRFLCSDERVFASSELHDIRSSSVSESIARCGGGGTPTPYRL